MQQLFGTVPVSISQSNTLERKARGVVAEQVRVLHFEGFLAGTCGMTYASSFSLGTFQ